MCISTYNIYYGNNSNTHDNSRNSSILTHPKIERLVSVIRKPLSRACSSHCIYVEYGNMSRFSLQCN